MVEQPFNLDEELIVQPGMISEAVTINPNVTHNIVAEAVSKEAVNNTILGGVSAKNRQGLVDDTASEIIDGNKSPGFFQGLQAALTSPEFLSIAGGAIGGGLAGQGAGLSGGFGAGAVLGGGQAAQRVEALGAQGLETTKKGAQERTKLAASLRTEANKSQEIKDFKVVDSNVDRMDTAIARALKNPTGSKVAIDQALVATFNKILDPGSVVRESEFARTAASLGLSQRIQGNLAKLAEGGAGLTPEVRADLVELAKEINNTAREKAQTQIDFFSGEATTAGIDPKRVVGAFKTVTEKKSALPSQRTADIDDALGNALPKSSAQNIAGYTVEVE